MSNSKHQAVVLFVHHMDNKLTRKHFRLLEKHNDFPIVPICCDDGQQNRPLKNAVWVPKTFCSGNNWHNVDWICAEWFRNESKVVADRYIWIDWDCRVDVPLENWYGKETWNQDFVASHILKPPCPWYWFDVQIPKLPRALQHFAIGVAPLNGVMLSHTAMSMYADLKLPDGIFSELRLGTVLGSIGINPTPLPSEKASRNLFLEDGKSINVDDSGFSHPVKVANSRR